MEIVVEGARPYDGRYPLIPFNRYEQGQIRRLAGWMPLQYGEALEGGDAEFIAVLAVLSMKRAGRVEEADVPDTFRRILNIDGAEITLAETADDREREEEPAGPPPLSSSLNSDTSGPGSSRSSETSPQTRLANGMPGSDISESAQIRSAS